MFGAGLLWSPHSIANAWKLNCQWNLTCFCNQVTLVPFLTIHTSTSHGEQSCPTYIWRHTSLGSFVVEPWPSSSMNFTRLLPLLFWIPWLPSGYSHLMKLRCPGPTTISVFIVRLRKSNIASSYVVLTLMVPTPSRAYKLFMQPSFLTSRWLDALNLNSFLQGHISSTTSTVICLMKIILVRSVLPLVFSAGEKMAKNS